MEYTRMDNLSATDYMYPGENNVFSQIRKVPLLNDLMGKALAVEASASCLPEAQASYYRVTEKSCPGLHRVFELAKARLDIHGEIPLFILPSFDFNACAYGGSAPFIIIHSSFVKNCTDEELLFVLGHELGHIKGNHAVYKSVIVKLLNAMLKAASSLPILPTVKEAIEYSLFDWDRKMEYSADRAGAIAAGDPENAVSAIQTLLGVHQKLPGVHVTVEDLMAQSAVYQEENRSLVSKIVLLNAILKSSHPWSVNRISELEKWKASGEFEQLIQEKGAA